MKIVKKRNGSFHKLSDEEAEKLVQSGKAQIFDLTKGLQEPPKNKAILSPKKSKTKGK